MKIWALGIYVVAWHMHGTYLPLTCQGHFGVIRRTLPSQIHQHVRDVICVTFSGTYSHVYSEVVCICTRDWNHNVQVIFVPKHRM